MKIIWSPQARTDLREIYLHILPDSLKAARTQHERIRAGVQLLADNPKMGRSGRVPGTREMVVSGTRYIIPYRISQGTLQILRVYHTARQWPEAFE